MKQQKTTHTFQLKLSESSIIDVLYEYSYENFCFRFRAGDAASYSWPAAVLRDSVGAVSNAGRGPHCAAHCDPHARSSRVCIGAPKRTARRTRRANCAIGQRQCQCQRRSHTICARWHRYTDRRAHQHV